MVTLVIDFHPNIGVIKNDPKSLFFYSKLGRYMHCGLENVCVELFLNNCAHEFTIVFLN